MAISFLGSSPRVGRPTRRMRESCLSERSGISEKSILFDFVDFSFFPARPPRADNPRDLFIAFAPCRVSYNEHSPQTAQGHAQAARLGERVLQILAVQTIGIEKSRGRFFERDAVPELVGSGLQSVPIRTFNYVYT